LRVVFEKIRLQEIKCYLSNPERRNFHVSKAKTKFSQSIITDRPNRTARQNNSFDDHGEYHIPLLTTVIGKSAIFAVYSVSSDQWSKTIISDQWSVISG
jgi:hypothetical protein